MGMERTGEAMTNEQYRRYAEEMMFHYKERLEKAENLLNKICYMSTYGHDNRKEFLFSISEYFKGKE